MLPLLAVSRVRKLMALFPLLFAAVALLASLTSLRAQNSPADFTLHSSVVATSPPRIGFNTQPSPNCVDITDNVWNQDGGFSPMDVRWSYTATDGGANTFIVTNNGGTATWSCLSNGFFLGANARTYRLSGTAWTLLRTDTVTGFTAVAKSSLPADNTITFASSGPAIQSGDIVWLSMDNIFNMAKNVWQPNLGAGGSLIDSWNREGSGGDVNVSTCSISYVPDGAPGTTYGPIGTNTPSGIKITSTTSEVAGIWQFNGGLQAGKEIWESGHTYQVDVWLKQTGITSGSATVLMTNNHAPYGGINHGFIGITGTWQKFTWQFPAPTTLPVANGARLRLDFNGPGILNVSQFFIHDAAAPAFTTDSDVLAEWTNFRPGSLRIWSGFCNQSTGYSFMSLEAFLAPESASHGVIDITSGPNTPLRMAGLQEHLPAALDICKRVGTTPWIIGNMSWNEQDWSHLIDYLCATGSGGYAAYRPANHRNPYIDDFSTIYIEFGNEEWGTQVTPWNANYGLAAHLMLSSAKSNPNFNSRIKFVVNGFSGIPSFGLNAISACPEASVVSFANYVGASGTGDAIYQSDLLALPGGYQAHINNWVSDQKTSAANGHPYTIAVYEGGPGNDDPNSGSNVGDNSLAVAVGALDVDLYGSQSGIGPQNLFKFNPDLGTWSSHTNISRGFIPHPVWEALQMRNNYCNGDMVAIDTNANPLTTGSHNYPLTGCYAFKDGNQADIVVISRDLNNATPVTLHLPTAFAGSATLYKLTGDPRANNNTALNIPIQSQIVSGFSRDYTFSMPAGSIYIFQAPMTWLAVSPAGFAAAGGSGRITLSWAPYAGVGSYNIYRSTTPGGEGRTPYALGLSGTTYVDFAVSSDTTYYYKISAVVGGIETDQSTQTLATPLSFGTMIRSNACGVTSGTLPTGWSFDAGYSGGNNYAVNPFTSGSINVSATNAAPAQIYLVARACHGLINYTLTGLKPNSNYTARLHFDAASGTPVGYEVFHISINGVQRVTSFDPAAGGTRIAIVQELPCVADNAGTITILLTQATGAAWAPAISGVQLLTGTPGSDVTSGLMARYNFEANVQDTSTVDSIADNATAVGSPTYASSGAPVGANSIILNGTTQYVTVANSTEVNLTTAGTIAVWVKVASTTDNAYRMIASKRLTFADSAGYEFFYHPVLNRLYFRSGGTSTSYSFELANLDLDTGWHHLAVTVNGSVGKFYVDGVPQTVNVSGSVANPLTSTQTLMIGRRSGTTDYPWNGQLDDLRLYNRDLSATEIQAVYVETQ